MPSLKASDTQRTAVENGAAVKAADIPVVATTEKTEAAAKAIAKVTAEVKTAVAVNHKTAQEAGRTVNTVTM